MAYWYVKHIKMWGVRVYIINVRVTIKKLDDISNRGYFMGYEATTGVILYCKPYQPFLSTYPIMFGLMNIIIVSPYDTSIIQVRYSFENILKVIFIIQTSSNWFHVNLILHPLHFVIQKFSHMKFSYLPLEIKLVLIYWMMKVLQSHTSLIQSQIHQLVINFQHRLI